MLQTVKKPAKVADTICFVGPCQALCFAVSWQSFMTLVSRFTFVSITLCNMNQDYGLCSLPDFWIFISKNARKVPVALAVKINE